MGLRDGLLGRADIAVSGALLILKRRADLDNDIRANCAKNERFQKIGASVKYNFSLDFQHKVFSTILTLIEEFRLEKRRTMDQIGSMRSTLPRNRILWNASREVGGSQGRSAFWLLVFLVEVAADEGVMVDLSSSSVDPQMCPTIGKGGVREGFWWTCHDINL